MFNEKMVNRLYFWSRVLVIGSAFIAVLLLMKAAVFGFGELAKGLASLSPEELNQLGSAQAGLMTLFVAFAVCFSLAIACIKLNNRKTGWVISILSSILIGCLFALFTPYFLLISFTLFERYEVAMIGITISLFLSLSANLFFDYARQEGNVDKINQAVRIVLRKT